MDAFAVSVGAGTLAKTKGTRPVFRLSFHFGLFQFLMPVVGWFIGSGFKKYIEHFDHWIAFILLGYVGIKMIISGISSKNESSFGDPSKGMNLIILSIATSIDALAVGLSLAILNVNIWYPAIIIGIVTSFLCIIGIYIGNRLGSRFGKIMELFGGIILISIGLKILITHLSA